jgi:hypothetical protein
MPNRVIWPAIKRSRKIDATSPEAEVLFYRLLASADDFGRFHADPKLVLGECFPLRIGTVTPKQVQGWLVELARVRLIRIYQVGDEAYLEFAKWEQRTRASQSRYPDPPTDDGQLTVTWPAGAHVDVDVDVDEDVSIAQPAAARSRYPKAFEEFWVEFPLHRGKDGALRSWKKVRARGVPNEVLIDGAKAYAADPSRDPTKTKYAQGWLNDGRWQDEVSPNGSKPDPCPDCGIDRAGWSERARAIHAEDEHS